MNGSQASYAHGKSGASEAHSLLLGTSITDFRCSSSLSGRTRLVSADFSLYGAVGDALRAMHIMCGSAVVCTCPTRIPVGVSRGAQ